MRQVRRRRDRRPAARNLSPARGHYDIQVKGVLEAGPNAERSPTYFFQDGDHQEKLFRAIEASHPDIEHLGNWHTHHVNGYPTLSGGDKTTYFKTVNHDKHNTDFFYALLVVSKNRRGNPRYAIKHFIFRRGDDTIYEIPDAVTTWCGSSALPTAPGRHDGTRRTFPPARHEPGANPERAKDQEFFSEFYPGLKALFSKNIGAPYWKGPLPLVDGSHAEVVAMENAEGGAPSYSIATSSRIRRSPTTGAVQGTAIPLGAARRPASGARSQSGDLSRQGRGRGS